MLLWIQVETMLKKVCVCDAHCQFRSSFIQSLALVLKLKEICCILQYQSLRAMMMMPSMVSSSVVFTVLVICIYPHKLFYIL